MIENIDQLIKTKKYPQILLMFGEEDFLRDEAYDKLINSIFPDRSNVFDFETVDGDDTTINNITDVCRTFPFISEKRVVAVKHFNKLFDGTKSKKGIEKSPFARYLDSPHPSTFLILLSDDDNLNGLAANLKNPKNAGKAEKTIKSAKFPYNLILQKHEWIEFPKIYESDYYGWAEKRFKSLGMEISPEACEILISQTSQSLREISNELEKISIYSQSKKLVNVEDVSKIIGISRVYNIFELQKAIGKRLLPEALEILENMLAAERQEMLIMAMLTKYFTTIWKLLEEAGKTTNQYQLAGNVGINPYFIGEYLAVLKKYTSAEIDKAFFSLSEADKQLKSSAGSSLYILQKMLIEIMEK